MGFVDRLRSLRIYRQLIVTNLTVACQLEVASTLATQTVVNVYVYFLSGVVAANTGFTLSQIGS
jgi:hypothetical protein